MKTLELIDKKEANKRLFEEIRKKLDNLDIENFDIEVSNTPITEEYINCDGKGTRYIYNELNITIRSNIPIEQKIDKMKGMY